MCDDDVRCEAAANANRHGSGRACDLVVTVQLKLETVSRARGQSNAMSAALQSQIANALTHCDSSDVECLESQSGSILTTMISLQHDTGLHGSEAEVRTALINTFAEYQPTQMEYDWTEFCSQLITAADGRGVEYDHDCCAKLGAAGERHCGPRPPSYMKARMLWNNDKSGAFIAETDAQLGYRFIPTECETNKLKLKPKWKEVDLEGDDWRLSALMRLLAGVEGDYEKMTSFTFRSVFTNLVGNAAEATIEHMEHLPLTWRGFPIYVNPTCSGDVADSGSCSFVFLWIASHSAMTSIASMLGSAGSPDYLGRAVLSRSHPALIYWRALTEPRDMWDCDAHGDQCKYDKAHTDDCIDHVTFPAVFMRLNQDRSIEQSLASPLALWRSTASGAKVFSEALFDGIPNTASSDLVDGFNVTCDPGTFEAPAPAVGKNTFVGEDDDEDGDSPVLKAMGNLADSLGPLALPLAPLVVAYVAFDELLSTYELGTIQKQAARMVDRFVSPLATFFEWFFGAILGA